MRSWRSGDGAVGYELTFDEGTRVITMRARGFWDDAMAARFRDSFDALWRSIDTSEPTYVLADVSQYPAQRDSVQAVHAGLMQRGREMGVKRSANLVSAALTSMQIRRLSKESGLVEHSFFKDETEALKWLLAP